MARKRKSVMPAVLVVGAGLGGLFLFKALREKKDQDYRAFATTAATGPAPPPEDPLTAAFWASSPGDTPPPPPDLTTKSGRQELAIDLSKQAAKKALEQLPEDTWKIRVPLGAPPAPLLTIHERNAESLKLRMASSGLQTLAATTKRMESAGASQIEAMQTAANAISVMRGTGIPYGPDPVVQGQNLLANDRALTSAARQSAAAGRAMMNEAARIGADEAAITMQIVRNDNAKSAAFVSRSSPKTQMGTQATAAAELVKRQLRARNGEIQKMELQFAQLDPYGQERYGEQLERTMRANREQVSFLQKRLSMLRAQGARA